MQPEENKIKLQALVDQFKTNIKQYKSSSYDEANTRVDFIDKFFELLDWDVRNTQGFSEDFREVVREDKIYIAGKPKAPDYSFRIGGRRIFFVEAKKPSIDIKDNIEPAFQLRRYAYTARLPLSILTDFEEFAVYDTRIKPDHKDKAGAARVFYCTFDNYLEPNRENPDITNIDYISSIFSKPAVLKGRLKNYVDDSMSKKGTSEVDKEFLKMIEAWRTDLARNIALRNKGLDVYNINYAVQKIIDRIIFLRIAEDRHMEEYGSLSAIAREEDIYRKLDEIFRRAYNKYNSSLFHIEDWLSKLELDNKVISSIFQNFYPPKCPYEMSVLPIEILGHIYEQFLGKTIRLTASHQAKVEEKPEVRKAGGVYYTPQYIVDYIVENTVGEKVKGKKPEDIASLKILDPACGSGSFLVGAYTYLLNYHLEYYTKNTVLKKSLKESKIYQVAENSYRLSTEEKQRILINNIYGVDIDNQAVEVTKLSLLLKLMEGEYIESSEKLFKHTDLKLLPDLSDNIKCGNSLIGSDFYDDKNLDLFGKEDIRKVNAFDWEEEFLTSPPAPLQIGEGSSERARSAGSEQGFDVVIGNPPYVRQELLSESKDYFQSHYTTFQGTADLYVIFIEKGYKILKEGGLFSYIVANKWMRANYAKGLREWLSKKRIEEIIDFGDLPVFEQATTYPCIFRLKKAKPAERFSAVNVEHLNFKSLTDYVEENRLSVSQSGLSPEGWHLANEAELKLLEKLKQKGIPLKQYVEDKIYYGIKTGYNTAFVIDNEIRERLIKEDPKSEEVIKPFLAGRDIKRYAPLETDKYLIFTRRGINIKDYPAIEEYLIQFKNDLMPKPKNWSGGQWSGRKPGNYKWYEIQDAVDYYEEFEKPKIIIPAISNKANYTLDDSEFYSNDKTSIIVHSDNKYLIGLLNSKLLDYYIFSIASTKRGGYFEYKPMYVGQLPIKAIDLSDSKENERRDNIIGLVDQMFSSQKDLHNANAESDIKVFQQKVDLLDRQIDNLVYELYGLSEEEIGVVEGK